MWDKPKKHDCQSCYDEGFQDGLIEASSEIEELVDIIWQYSLNACTLGISHPHLAPDKVLEGRAKKAAQKHTEGK